MESNPSYTSLNNNNNTRELYEAHIPIELQHDSAARSSERASELKRDASGGLGSPGNAREARGAATARWGSCPLDPFEPALALARKG